MDRKIIQAVIFSLIVFAGCRPRESVIPKAPENIVGPKVFVVCEGAYGTGNSALSLYLPHTEAVYEDVYKSANGGTLGDVFQSMIRIGNHYFLCINNSDKIAVIDTGTWHLAANISVPKPRYILPVSATKAYVSTLFSNKVYIINPQTLQVTGSISTPYQNPEGMLLLNNRAIICNWDTAAHSLTTIDVATDAPGPSIPLSNASPTDALIDGEGMMWVLTGNVDKGRPALLSRLNPATGAVLTDFPFPAAADALRPCFNAAKDTLYWIEANYAGGAANNGVYRMGIHNTALPASAFIQAQSLEYFWGIGIEPASGNIYVGNPLGFLQSGQVQVYRPDGTPVKTFTTGVGPGHFYFEQ